MSTSRPSALRILHGVALGAAVVAPLLLLLDLSASFLQDWPIHLWMINYYADYFRQHGELPTVINFPHVVGVALPVFYANLLYPLLGILSAVVGAALALRLALCTMLAIQFFALMSAGRKIFGQSTLAYVVAVSVIWGTYSLTNLYNRGALAEYFATGFYVTAIAFSASAAVAAPGAGGRFHGWMAGVFLLLAIGSHPPTAVLGVGFIVVLGGAVAVGWGRGRLKFSAGDGVGLALGALGGAVILAPWSLANVMMRGQLAIAQAPGGFQFVPEHCDSLWGRFAPFPFDAASVENGIDTVGTAYLEAPVNVVLLGILLWNIELCRRFSRRPFPAGATGSSSPAREILGAAIAWFALLVTLSLSPWLAECCVFLAPYIQYVYRLVSHCNAALLAAVFASGVLVARQAGYRRHRHQTNVVLAVGLTVAVLGLGLKLQHAAVAEATEGAPPRSLAPGLMEITRAYATPGLVRELREDEARSVASLAFPIGPPGAGFGEVGTLNINQRDAGWVQTNAVVFPWLIIVCDGQVLSGDQLAQTGHFLAIHLLAGNHQLRAVWQPDRTWSVLNRLSQAVFALVLLGTLGWAAARQIPGRRGPEPAR